MDLGDNDFLQAARRIARDLGESHEVTRLEVDATHPVFRAGPIVIRLEIAEVARDVAWKVENCRRLCASGVPFVVPLTDEPMSVPGWEPVVATAWE